MKILIIDDNPTNLKLLRLTLENEGHIVVEASDGAGALTLLGNEPVDAIVSDVMMPNMDGFQFCHLIRLDERWHELPLILYSNTFSSQSSAQLGLEFGADAFLKKPASAGVIVERLKKIIEERPHRHRPSKRESISMFQDTQPYSRNLIKLLEEQAVESERTRECLLATNHTSLTRLRELENNQEELQRQAALINQSFDAVLVWDWNGVITFWNPGAEELYGFSSADAIGRASHELLRTEFPQTAELFLAQLESEGRIRDELQHTTRDGRRIVVESRMRLVRARSGTYVIETNRDITEQRQADEKLKTSLRETWDLKIALDEHAIVATTDARGKITFVNDKFCKIAGYSREELIGQDHRLINSGHHSKEFFHDLWSTISAGKSWHGEIENRAKDGSYYWVDTTIVPFLDEDNRPRQYMAIRAVITERKQAEAKIRELNATLERRVAERTAQLEATNKELEAFSYSVSHDLRAPLRGIDSFSRMVIEDYGPKLDAEGHRQLNVIRGEAQRMGQLIDELLRFSRLAREEIRSASCDMTALVQSVFDEIPAAARKHVKEFRLHPLPPAYGDRAMIRQALVNLISNAVKYSATVAAPSIEVSGERVDGICTYRVKDNGVGFDPRYAHKLFDVFQRLHSEHEFEGTGVGLAIVQRIIHRHGGKVWAEGTLGAGATFSFTLAGEGQKSPAQPEACAWTEITTPAGRGHDLPLPRASAS